MEIIDMKSEKLRQLLSETSILLAISLTQAAAYIALLFWPKIDLAYYCSVVFISTIIFSIYVKNIKKSIFYTFAALILGAIISVGILLMPMAVYGADSIDYAVGLYEFYIAKPLVLDIVICMIAVILGSFLSDGM